MHPAGDRLIVAVIRPEPSLLSQPTLENRGHEEFMRHRGSVGGKQNIARAARCHTINAIVGEWHQKCDFPVGPFEEPRREWPD
jgi:hypothetical protein